MKKYKVISARDWEAEAVDFVVVELAKLEPGELFKYAWQAQTFISKTMNRMELRPKRSLMRRRT